MVARSRPRVNESYLHSWRVGGYKAEVSENHNVETPSFPVHEDALYNLLLNASPSERRRLKQLANQRHTYEEGGARTKKRQHSQRGHKPVETLHQLSPGLGSVDPFDTSATFVSNQEYSVMHAYGLSLLRRSWPQEGGFYDMATKRWMAECGDALTSVSAAHSLMASTLMWASVQIPDPHRRSRVMRRALQHQALALPALRKDLNDERLLQQNIKAVFFVAAGLLFAGRPAETVLHLSFLKTLISQLGGMSCLPIVLRPQIVAIDVICSGSLMTRPVFPGQDDTFEDLFPDLNPAEVSDLALFRSSLRSLPHTLSATFVKPLKSYHGLLALKHLVASNVSDPDRQMELLRRINITRWAQMSLIQHKRYELNILSIASQSPKSNLTANERRTRSTLALDLCFRICLLHVTWLLVYPSVSELTIPGDFDDLGVHLYNEAVHDLCPDFVYFWMLGAASILEHVLGGHDGKQWHARKFLRKSVRIGIPDFDGLCDQMQELLPINDTIKEILAELWSRRKELGSDLSVGEPEQKDSSTDHKRKVKNVPSSSIGQKSFVLKVGGAKPRVLLTRSGVGARDFSKVSWRKR